jgi:sporulation protein YlmC with PRC-barrel domain
MPTRIARAPHALISSEDVEGVSVYDANKKKIGKVDHLMVEKRSGQVTYVVISGAGFLGLGHSHYRLPWGQLKYSMTLNAFEIDLTESAMKADPSISGD